MPSILAARQQQFNGTTDDSSSNTKWYIVGGIGGVILILCVVIVFCFMRRRKGKKPSQSAFEPFTNISIPMLHNTSKPPTKPQHQSGNLAPSTGYSAHPEQSHSLLADAAAPGQDHPSRPNSTVSVPPAIAVSNDDQQQQSHNGHGLGQGFMGYFHNPFHSHDPATSGQVPPKKVGEAAQYYSMTAQGHERSVEA